MTDHIMTDCNSDQKYIYVMLSRTHTIPARLIRLYSRVPYSHTSIALDPELSQMYSFARKGVWNPLNSGFIREDINSGILGRDKNVYCSIYAVPVSDEQYEAVKREIDHFINNHDQYGYNFVGLFAAMLELNIEDGKHFMCSQFVNHIFDKSGMPLFDEDKNLIKPYDFHIKLKNYRIYRGKLTEYRSFLKRRSTTKGMGWDEYVIPAYPA